AVLAGTALVDALVVLKRRRPDTEVPVGTIRGCALLVGALATLPSFVVLVLGHSGGHWDLLEWSALPFTFLLVAVTGLLLARNLGSGAGPMLLVSLLLFGTAVLTASGPYLPVLPREIGRAHVELQSRFDLVCRLLLEKKKREQRREYSKK